MKYPHVLVVSNNSFSKTGSNGRTLASFFQGWPKDCIAQFCISTDEPDYNVCDNYFLITDKSAVDGFRHFRKARRCNIQENLNSKGNSKVTQTKVVSKSPSTIILRNIIWKPKRWKSKEFVRWVDEFHPEIVLLMNSDSVFIHSVARDLSLDRRIPIVMFNTEGFYFFKKPFIKSRGVEDLLFKAYQRFYRRAYSRTMKQVALSCYLNSKLQSDYDEVFGEGESIVLYTGSNITPPDSRTLFNVQSPVFSYIGNLAYSRIDALIEVAAVLQSICPNYVLDVYGSYNETIEVKTKNNKGIRLKGFISYEQVLETINNSDILFHAETQDPKWAEALKYGFSTKIADSICSGKCFVMYSSPEIAGADYLIKSGAGWFASNKEELKQVIVTILNDQEKREQVLNKAKEVAIQCHQSQTNCKVFQKAIIEVLERYANNNIS